MTATSFEKTLRHRQASINGSSLHYVEAGEPAKRLILFLHGFPEAWFAWRSQMESLSDRFHVVALDTRGINLSEKPVEVEQYRAVHLVEDVVALVKHLGHESCVLVGHDWGGAIAWGVAINRPEIVTGLCILNGVHPLIFARELLQNEAQKTASRYMLDFRKEDFATTALANDCSYLVSMLCNDGRRPAWLDEGTFAEYRKAWTTGRTVACGLAYYKASPLYPGNDAKLRQMLAMDKGAFRVTAPTLVLWGARDRYLLKGCVEGLDALVDDLSLHVFPDASHWIAHEVPESVNRHLDVFVSRLPA